MKRLRGELRGRPLSGREQEVLVAVVNEAPERRHGRSSRTIAAACALGVSIHAARKYLEGATLKLGARSTEHAIALAFPQLGHRYLETPDRRRMAALAHEVLQRRSAT